MFDKLKLILPGQEHVMRMKHVALFRVVDYLNENREQIRPGHKFSIEGTDKKKLIILLE